ncbi:MAG: hypothetical protein KatS3mg109_0166 [Pirellulaceae bacterium]|nr:MAG: hypothetical protein KatS3mg109_0166 [Pirellulaceae bacterium]
MAILKRVHLRNFAQHKDCVAEFGPGVTVITGPMGSGKTNLMLAAAASLSNDFGAFVPKKKDLIRRHSSGSSFIATQWLLDDGTVVDVVRSLRKESSYYSLNGERQPERRESEITEALAQLIGFDPRLLIQNHCIQQSKVDAIISDQPADRVHATARLFSISQELLPDLTPYQEELARVSAELAGFDDKAIGIYRADRVSFASEYWKMVVNRWTDLAYLLSDEDRKRYEGILKKLERRESLFSERNVVSRNISRRRDMIVEAEQLLKKFEASIADKEARVDELSAELASCKSAAQTVKLKRSYEQQLKAAKDDKAEAGMALLESPVKPQTPEPSEEEIQGIRDELWSTQRLLELSKSGLSECETCGSPLPTSPDDVEPLTEKVAELRAILQEKQQVKSEWNWFRKDLEKWPATESALLARIAESDLEIDRLTREISQLELPEGDPDKILQRVTRLSHDLQVEKAELDKLRKDQMSLVSRLSSYRTKLADDQKSLDDIRNEISSIPPQSDPIYAEAEEKLRLHREAAARQLKYESDRVGLLVKSRFARQQYRDAVEQAKNQKKMLIWRDSLEEALVAYRPTNMPKAVLSSLLESLSGPISTVCRSLGLPFTITSDSNLTLTAHHPDESIEPAACLSGGQKACVSIAFWTSKLLAVRGGLDTLFLDEPTANLDEEAVSQFADVLMEIGKLMLEKRKQLIIATHHRQLEVCAQHVFSLYR